MSKIVQAINSMITNKEKISNVIKSSEEYFFLYKSKYKWSMALRDDGYHLWYYPGGDSLDFLASMAHSSWDNGVPMIHYFDGEIGTKEARASFAELYTILSEKLYGIDDVLNDIISDDIPF